MKTLPPGKKPNAVNKYYYYYYYYYYYSARVKSVAFNKLSLKLPNFNSVPLDMELRLLSEKYQLSVA